MSKHIFQHTHHGAIAGAFTFTVNNGDIKLVPYNNTPTRSEHSIVAEPSPNSSEITGKSESIFQSSDTIHKNRLGKGRENDDPSSTYTTESVVTSESDDSYTTINHNLSNDDSQCSRPLTQTLIKPLTVSANFVAGEYVRDRSDYTKFPDTPTDSDPSNVGPDCQGVNCSNTDISPFHQHETSPESTVHLARHSSDAEEANDTHLNGLEDKTNEEECLEEEEAATMNVISCLPLVKIATPVKPDKDAEWKSRSVYVVKAVLFVIAFPFACAFSWTIPDCSKKHNRKWFMVSFSLSVIWIAMLSVVMVTLVSRLGCIIGIDNFTMGLVVVAVGTSVPDTLSSILVARDGFGDMAVSNAIGSNVFDIDLGLGLPFIITVAIRGPINLLGPLDQCLKENNMLLMTQHAKFGFILFFILILTLVTFGAARFRLTKPIGVAFVCIYFVFLVYSFVQEFYCKGVYC